MKILVFVKRVPDTGSVIRIQPGTGRIVEDGLSFIMSPYDEYAVEEALRLKEACGGEVTAVSVGREDAAAVLRKCLAMGADEAWLIKDDLPETFDGLRMAKIIAGLVRQKFPRADLLLFGRQSAGADNGQSPAMTAALLGLPQATEVTRLEVTGDRATAWREIEGGIEKTEFELPAVVSAHKGLNEPRYETLRGIMAAKKKTIPVLSPEELELSPEQLAPAVSILDLDVPPAKQAGKSLRGNADETVKELVRLLREEAKVI